MDAGRATSKGQGRLTSTRFSTPLALGGEEAEPPVERLMGEHEAPGEVDPAEGARVGDEDARDGGGEGAPVDAVFEVQLPDEVAVLEDAGGGAPDVAPARGGDAEAGEDVAQQVVGERAD